MGRFVVKVHRSCCCGMDFGERGGFHLGMEMWNFDRFGRDRVDLLGALAK